MKLLGPDVLPIDLGSQAKTQPLPFAPLEVVLSSVPSEPDWIWKGYVAPGCLTLLAGRPKAGKSTLVFALLGALRTGRMLLGQPTGATKVVILTEEGHHTLAEKARQMGVNGDGHVHVLLRHQAFGRRWPEVVGEAIQYAESTGAQLLVIDTFAEWAELAGDEENIAGSMLEALRPLRVATGRALAVLLVAHQRKSSGQHGTAVRGSTALTGSVDIILELERPKKGKNSTLPPKVRVLRSESRFCSTPSETIAILENSDYLVLGGSSQTGVTEMDKLISALLEHNKGSAASLAGIVSRPPSTVRKRLEILREADKVSRSGKGVRGSPYVYQPTQILSAHIELYSAETNPRDDRPQRSMVDRSGAPSTKSAIITVFDVDGLIEECQE